MNQAARLGALAALSCLSQLSTQTPPAKPALDGRLTCVVQVKDLDKAIAWYADALDLRLLWQDPQIGFAEVATKNGDVQLGLARHEQPSVTPGVVLTFGVRDLAAAERALHAKKVKTGQVVEYPGLVRLLEFQDHDGNTMQLFESLQKPPPSHAGFEAVAFLAGSWLRVEGDRREEEHWMAPAGGMMVGMSRNVRGDQVTSFEGLRIEKRAEGLVYVANPSGQAGAEFPHDPKLSKDGKVVFQNPAHDFPRRILYWLGDDGRLHARIEGEVKGKAMARDFVWERGGLR